MNFELSEEHRQIRATVANFAEREIKPFSTHWDKTEHFPREVIEKIGALGFLGVSFPERFGGGAADTLAQALVVEGLSRFDASIGLTCAAHMALSTSHIERFAADAHRDRYVPDMIAGKKLGAWCLTEPGSGSDAAAMSTRAAREGDRYAISGIQDVHHQRQRRRRLRGDGGDRRRCGPQRYFRFRDRSRHARTQQWPQDRETGIARFRHRRSDPRQRGGTCRNLIGAPGEGYTQALKILEAGRIGIAGFAIGIARGALEDSAAYAKERKQFGRPIADLQAIQWMLADMATRIEASWMLLYRAAELKDKGRPFGRQSAMAKLYASETAMWSTIKGVQIHGGYGYVTDFPMERYMRDAKLAEIGEGTSEVQRMIIAKSLLKEGYLAG